MVSVPIISYQVPELTRVSIRIYDLRGRIVSVLVDGLREPGSYSVLWNGRNRVGEEVPSGIYLCTMETGSDAQSTRKLVLMK